MSSNLALPAGEPPISFKVHEVRAGVAGAREEFEQMIAQLVAATTPGVRMIAANPGDWGVDAFAGDLGGEIVVWQSKYFMPVVQKSHQQEIRESFASVLSAAAREGHKIRQWILCVPSSMDAPTTQWWDRRKPREQNKNDLAIELWDETMLRRRLISPEAEDVRRHYYSWGATAPSAKRSLKVVEPPQEASDELDRALFVRQLKEAGHIELFAAKKEFFNAELIAREIVDKGVPSEMNALAEADTVTHGIWEARFNESCSIADDPKLPGLHYKVMSDIRATHPDYPSALPGGIVHSCGLMHRIVEDRRAGWVQHWRDVAARHRVGDDGGSATPDGLRDGSNERT